MCWAADSNDVVHRRNPRFLAQKASRTTRLIQEMLDAIPDGYGMNLKRSETPPKRAYWEYDDDMELDSNTLFTMRGATAQQDPGYANLMLRPNYIAPALLTTVASAVLPGRFDFPVRMRRFGIWLDGGEL